MTRSAYSQWYTQPRWRVKRRQQLDREPLCAFCKAMGRVVPATVADHVEPHRGDLERFWNGPLQSLCGTCHSSTKQRMEAGKRIAIIGVDGWPVEP